MLIFRGVPNKEKNPTLLNQFAFSIGEMSKSSLNALEYVTWPLGVISGCAFFGSDFPIDAGDFFEGCRLSQVLFGRGFPKDS